MLKDVKETSNKAKYSLSKYLQSTANEFAESIFAISSTIYNTIKKVIVRFLDCAPNLFVYILLAWTFYFFVKIIWIISSVI